jgi:hypothetical protein
MSTTCMTNKYKHMLPKTQRRSLRERHAYLQFTHCIIPCKNDSVERITEIVKSKMNYSKKLNMRSVL